MAPTASAAANPAAANPAAVPAAAAAAVPAHAPRTPIGQGTTLSRELCGQGLGPFRTFNRPEINMNYINPRNLNDALTAVSN
jgi:hypothetical protein